MTILYSASDDIPYSDEIKILLKDIREIRKRKIKYGLKELNSNNLNVNIYNIIYFYLFLK